MAKNCEHRDHTITMMILKRKDPHGRGLDSKIGRGKDLINILGPKTLNIAIVHQ